MDEQKPLTKEQLDYAWNCKALISFICSCFIFAITYAVLQNYIFDIFSALIAATCCFIFARWAMSWDNEKFINNKNSGKQVYKVYIEETKAHSNQSYSSLEDSSSIYNTSDPISPFYKNPFD